MSVSFDRRGDEKDPLAVLQEAGVDVARDEVQARGKVRTATQAGRLLRGGGGTDMAPGFAAALKGRPDVIVCLTDGEVYEGWPSSCPVRAVVVVPEGAPATPQWAKRIEKRKS